MTKPKQKKDEKKRDEQAEKGDQSAKEIAEIMAENMAANMADPDFELKRETENRKAAQHAIKKHRKRLADAGISIPGEEKENKEEGKKTDIR